MCISQTDNFRKFQSIQKLILLIAKVKSIVNPYKSLKMNLTQSFKFPFTIIINLVSIFLPSLL